MVKLSDVLCSAFLGCCIIALPVTLGSKPHPEVIGVHNCVSVVLGFTTLFLWHSTVFSKLLGFRTLSAETFELRL
jgi:hypothetical protein